MRYGVCLLPDMPWSTAKPLWQRAEELGFDHAWTYDHLVWGGLPNSRWFSCIPTLTAAAAATNTLKVGSFVISPNFRHPVSTSRELQTLVDISDGRLIAALGVGGTPDDGILAQPKLSVGERVNRYQEFVKLLELTSPKTTSRSTATTSRPATCGWSAGRCGRVYRWCARATAPDKSSSRPGTATVG